MLQFQNLIQNHWLRIFQMTLLYDWNPKMWKQMKMSLLMKCCREIKICVSQTLSLSQNKALENDQPTLSPVPLYSNVFIMPYRSSQYIHYFQQVAKEKKKKYMAQEFPSSTIQSILFGLYNHFIFQKALSRQEREQMQKVIFEKDEEIESLREQLEKQK